MEKDSVLAPFLLRSPLSFPSSETWFLCAAAYPAPHHGPQYTHPHWSFVSSFFLWGGMTAGFLSACPEPGQLSIAKSSEMQRNGEISDSNRGQGWVRTEKQEKGCAGAESACGPCLPSWKHMAVIFKTSPSQRVHHKCFQLHLALWTGTPEDRILAASSLNAHQRKSRKEPLWKKPSPLTRCIWSCVFAGLVTDRFIHLFQHRGKGTLCLC